VKSKVADDQAYHDQNLHFNHQEIGVKFSIDRSTKSNMIRKRDVI